MDEPRYSDSLLGWGLGTFHLIFFILVLLIPLYFSGSLGSVLGSLNTLIGFALFIVLWGTTGWTTHRALQMLAGKQSWSKILIEGRVGPGKALGPGLLWGGINGALFFLILLLLRVIEIAALSIASIAITPAVFVFAVVGILVAFVLGALSGIILAFIDGFLLFLVRTISVNFIRRSRSER